MTLLDRIDRIVNTDAFAKSLEDSGVELWEFQISWQKASRGDFGRLPSAYQAAILEGESEIGYT